MTASIKSVSVGSSTIGSGKVEARDGVHEIAFIDPSVPHLDVLLKGMRRDVAVFLLSPVEPAALQMAREVAGMRDIDVVHVIAHGQAGEVHFSNGVLSVENVDDHRASLSRIGAALSADGEIRLWVCEAAGGERGADFVDALARISGVAVAASRRRIGAAEQGGSWSLEVRSSRRELPPLTAEAMAAYTGVMADFGATRGTDNVTLSTGNDTVVVTPLTIQAADRFDGGLGTDTIQIGVAGSLDVNLGAAASDGVNGFLSFEAIKFVNDGNFTLATATLAAAQFGEGKISTASTITGTDQRQALTVNLAPNGSVDLSGLKFSNWTSGTDTFTINGSTGAETIVGTSQNDKISTGGGGADTLAGGGGLDTFTLSASDNTLAFGVGTGTGGTVSGYDTITDFAPGQTATANESLNYAALSIGTSPTTNDSTFQVSASNETLKSHSITDGIITFDDASTFDSAVALTTAGDVAAAVEYLAANDWGNSGATVAFVATLSGVSHTYVYTQQSDSAGIANGSMVDLVNVRASSIVANGTTLSVVDATAPTAPSITTIAESSNGGINATEAVDGTTVVIDLSSAGATSNDTLTINWGSRTTTYSLTGADILAGRATVTVPPATIVAQGNGTFNVTAKLTDAAGNVSASSGSVSVKVDTTAAAPTLSLASDSGSSGDGVTNDGTVNVGGLEAGASWEYSTDGGTSWTAGVGTSFTLGGDGNKTAIARQTDVAGNLSAAGTLSFRLDTTTRAPTSLSLDPADDSGTSDSDGVTRRATGLTIGGLAETGATVSLFDDVDNSGALDNGETVLATTVAVAGAFSTDISLAEGSHHVRAFQTDLAGNVSAVSGALDLTADTTAAAPTLALATDSGSVDGITNVGTVEVSGLEAGASWEYSTDGGSSWTAGVFSSFTLDGDGNKTAVVRQTDVAGNLSASSGALAFTLDTTALAPTSLSLDSADDSGRSSGDGTTRNTTGLTISGLAESGATVSLFDDVDNSGAMDNGETAIATTVAVAGAFSADISLAEGLHHIRGFQTDVAGNSSTVSGALDIAVDVTADGGEAATLTIDNPLISSAETAAVTVAGLDGDATGVITFTDINGDVVTATVSGNGQVTKDLSGLADGEIVTTMEITDTAGNTANVAAVGNPVLNVAPELLVNLDQYNRFALTDELNDAAFTEVTVKAKGSTLAGLDPVADFAEMGPNGVDILKAKDGKVSLTVAQYQALGTVSLTDADVVTLVDTGSALASLLDGGMPAGVDALNATDDSLALSWAQYQNLGAIALNDDDAVSLPDDGATLSALSKADIAGLVAKRVDVISSISGGVSWAIQQFNALGSVILSTDTELALNGTAGKDTFSFSRQTLGAEDHVVGGDGTDRLVLSGDYSACLVFNADTLSGVEQILFGAGHSYDVATDDDTVDAGKNMLVKGPALGVADSLIFDGSAETNGTFTFKGGAGSNVFTGGTGADSIAAGAGADTLRYTSAAQSGLGSGYGSGYDTVSGFDGSVDRFALADTVVFDADVIGGVLSKGNFNTDVATALGSIEAGHAAIFTATDGKLAGATFLLANDIGGAGDLVVRLDGSANISQLSFTTA